MIIRLLRALVAQLDRALGYEPGGRGFDSLPARHLFFRIMVEDSYVSLRETSNGEVAEWPKALPC